MKELENFVKLWIQSDFDFRLDLLKADNHFVLKVIRLNQKKCSFSPIFFY